MNQITTKQSTSPLAAMADRLNIDTSELQDIVIKTVMPAKVQVSNEQFISFLAVANNYNLDPLKKEIYAFPAKGGGIQPVVSIDGWLGIINGHPQYDGMELDEQFDDKGVIFAVKCSIYRKDRNHPIVITEYLSECIRNTEPWKKKIRMLRHKSVIQCARYAFGLSGIMEQDEAEAAIEKDITPKKSTLSIPVGTDTETGEIPEFKPEPEPKKEPVKDRPLSIEEVATLMQLATVDNNGVTEWTVIACDVMTENKVDNIDKIPASKFELVKKQLSANLV